jgi:YHS domain-containing protein
LANKNGKIVVAKLDRTLLMGNTAQNELPIKGPETQEFITQVKTTLEQIKTIQNQVHNYTGNEGTTIEINRSTKKDDLNEFKSPEEICDEAFYSIEKMFKYRANDFDGNEGEEANEGEEEEQGEEEEEEQQEEEEEDEEDDNFDPILKDKKTQFGETNHYCPVTLFNEGILMPGNPELQGKFREKIYRFASEDCKASFLENPEHYLPSGNKRVKIPAPRILILGPRGSGKTTQARYLAERLDLFHIKFRDFLQEMIIGKTKKMCEPEKEEDKEPEKEEEKEEDEEETAGDGTVASAGSEKEVKEPLPQLTEKEEIIKGYLEKDDPLPATILDEIIRPLWTDEPYK